MTIISPHRDRKRTEWMSARDVDIHINPHHCSARHVESKGIPVEKETQEKTSPIAIGLLDTVLLLVDGVGHLAQLIFFGELA